MKSYLLLAAINLAVISPARADWCIYASGDAELRANQGNQARSECGFATQAAALARAQSVFGSNLSGVTIQANGASASTTGSGDPLVQAGNNIGTAIGQAMVQSIRDAAAEVALRNQQIAANNARMIAQAAADKSALDEKIKEQQADEAHQDVVRAQNALDNLQGVLRFSDDSTPPLKHPDSTTTIDARNVPSGLPKSVEDAIASGFATAPDGVSDRVRKGFEAITTHDWKVAKAWFEDALNRDPNNPNLKRLVELADYTEKREEQNPTSKPATPPPSTAPLQLPKDSDIELLFPGWQPAPTGMTSSSAGMPAQLPKDSDIEFLFPGLPAIQAKELNDYMFDQALKDTENDPVLIKLSNRPDPTQPQNIHN